MPYYQAGGYAYAAGGMSNYAAGGSIFGFLGKAVKSVAKVGAGLLTGGPLGGIAAAARELAPTPAANAPIPIMQPPFGLQGLQSLGPTPAQQRQGVVKVGVSPLGTVGVAFRKHRHMNAGNAKAARRAIRRIKSVRHLLTSIERELPHRKAVVHGGSRGVITRAEAARALRS